MNGIGARLGRVGVCRVYIDGGKRIGELGWGVGRQTGWRREGRYELIIASKGAH